MKGSERIIKVVLVDDSPVVRQRIADLLSDQEQIRVVGQADDAAQGAILIGALSPDVAVLDIDMPHESGIELLEALRRDHPGLVIIMLTNYDTVQLRRKCQQLGANHFFHKANEFEKLLAVIEQLAQNLSPPPTENS